MSKFYYCVTVVGVTSEERLRALLDGFLIEHKDLELVGEHESKCPDETSTAKFSIRKLNDKTGELTDGK